jgi:chloride channel 3/4/5
LLVTQTDRDVEAIRLDKENTVKTLRDQLLRLMASGQDDSGFPILRKESEATEGMRLVGFIGANELEHALSAFVPGLARLNLNRV